MVPRVHTVSLKVSPNEPVHITPLSDIHIDAEDCDYDGLRAMIAERNKLQNHRVILHGDFMNFVVPPDLKRYRPSVPAKHLLGKDDWINASVDYATERLKGLGCHFDLVAPGNHEDEALKRHGFDATSVIAHNLGAVRGGYSGIIRYRMVEHTTVKSKDTTHGYNFVIAYHHGAWGGKYAKGYLGAKDWFNVFQGWNVAVYGHNHQSRVDPEVRYRISRDDELVPYEVYYVCTGSWARTYIADGKITHYAERKGYAPYALRTPLIRAWIGHALGPGHQGRRVMRYEVVA